MCKGWTHYPPSLEGCGWSKGRAVRPQMDFLVIHKKKRRYGNKKRQVLKLQSCLSWKFSEWSLCLICASWTKRGVSTYDRDDKLEELSKKRSCIAIILSVLSIKLEMIAQLFPTPNKWKDSQDGRKMQ